jgi:predicted transposase YbfD/YdcC
MTQSEVLEYLTEALSAVPDPRKARGIRHELHDILTLLVLGAMAGCDTPEDVCDWIEENDEWLSEMVNTEHGYPCEDTFLRVLALMEPKLFDEALQGWLLKIRALTHPGPEGQIAIDGKTLRGSAGQGPDGRPVHIVGAFATSRGLALVQEVVGAKENEILAIPQLLERLNIKGTTVSIDAMGCQKDIAAQINDQGGKYLLAVKDNQPTLRRDIEDYLAWAMKSHHALDDQAPPVERFDTVDHGHGRVEERMAFLLPSHKRLSTRDEWKKLSKVGVIRSRRTNKATGREGAWECRYFISNDGELTAKQLLERARAHWAIENQLHWTLDVVFHEDASRVRVRNAAANLSLIRRLALNILRTAPSKRKGRSLRRKRKVCGWRPDRLFEAIAAIP